MGGPKGPHALRRSYYKGASGPQSSSWFIFWSILQTSLSASQQKIAILRVH